MISTERIKLIKEICNSLKSEDIGIVNLTLKEFRFPVKKLNSSGNKKFTSILSCIENGTTGQLKQLATHLRDTTKQLDVDPSFWVKDCCKVFISYSSDLKKTASLLKIALLNYGISAFVAHRDIKSTKAWEMEIERALKTCESLVALMSTHFKMSKWTDQEVGFAYGREIPIIPTNLGGKPYGFLAKFQVQEFDNTTALAKEIFETLVSHDSTKIKMAYAIMRKFEDSESFAKARENLNLLRKLKFWDKTLCQRLKKAKDINRQIRESLGVPHGIDLLLKKVKEKI